MTVVLDAPRCIERLAADGNHDQWVERPDLVAQICRAVLHDRGGDRIATASACGKAQDGVRDRDGLGRLSEHVGAQFPEEAAGWVRVLVVGQIALVGVEGVIVVRRFEYEEEVRTVAAIPAEERPRTYV